MKVKVAATLTNSWGEYEDGYSAEFDSLELAVECVNTRRLSGSPDCTMLTTFELYDNKGKLAYQGDSQYLKELFEIEKEERETFKNLRGEQFSEEELIDFLYDVEIWVVERSNIDDEYDSDYPVGYFEGTQKQVIDYIEAENEKTDRFIHHYVFVEKLN